MTLAVRCPIRKFNPGTFQSDREVMEQFVVRTRELDTVLGILRDNMGSPSCQHAVVVAPRGRGKTMLLARTAAELRTSGSFSGHLLPVRFMEESQEIFHLADFWLETLFHLARECESHDPGLARELRARRAALSERWREPALEDQARAAVLDAADRLDRRLVLMVENLQALSRDVDEDFGWKLRGALQTEPQIMLLGSATSRFSGLDDAEQPFFELFRIIDLKPLVTEECRLLWQVVSGDAVSGREMRPLEILTGGSPRLLVIVAGFARHRSMRRLMEELVVLIDDHTEYFRGHLEVLPKTERRTYLAVLDLWQRSTPGEIAARARMDIRTVSTMLGRLVNRGAVTVTGSGRKRQYAAAERLYSIYYKLRRERDEAAVVENMIRFMTVFYSEAEQKEMFPALLSEAVESAAIRDGLDRAAAGIPELGRLLGRRRRAGADGGSAITTEISSGTPGAHLTAGAGTDESVGRIRTEIAQRFGEGAFEKVVETVDRVLDPRRGVLSGSSETLVAWALNRKADAHMEMGHFDQAMAACSEVVERFGASQKTELQRDVAEALYGKSYVLLELRKPSSALSVCDDVVERFGGSGDSGLQGWVATALIWKAFVQEELGEFESAVLTYDRVVQRFCTSPNPELQRSVAEAMVDKGDALRRLGNAEGSLETYQDVVDRFGASDDPQLAGSIAKAQIEKGYLLRGRGEPASAISVWEEVVARFGTSDDPELQQQVARTMIGTGATHEELGDLDSALLVWQEILERFGSSTDVELQRRVGRALTGKASALEAKGKPDLAVLAYDEVVNRFGTSDDPELRYRLARALGEKGHAFEGAGRPDSAVLAYDEVVNRFGTSDDPELQWWVALALIGKGSAFESLGKPESEVRAYDQVVERFGTSDDSELQWWVALALSRKAVTHEKLGNLDAAVSAYEKVGQLFSASNDRELQDWVATAWIGKTEIQARTEHTDRASGTYVEVERSLNMLKRARRQELTCQAMRAHTQLLLVQEDLPAAMERFRSLYSVSDPANEAMLRGVLELVPDLAAAGAAATDLVEIVTGDDAKAAALGPLLVALRQEAGETVRAPAEILEVAADIRKEIQERRGP